MTRHDNHTPVVREKPVQDAKFEGSHVIHDQEPMRTRVALEVSLELGQDNIFVLELRWSHSNDDMTVVHGKTI